MTPTTLRLRLHCVGAHAANVTRQYMTLDRDTKKALCWDSGTRSSKSSQKVSGPDYSKSYVCLTCRTANKRHVEGTPSDYPLTMSCPICNDTMFNVGRHFKAPKKSDNAQWKKVGFLIAHGFLFQKIRPNPNSYESVPYPDTLEEAKEFVVKYKDWAITSAL